MLPLPHNADALPDVVALFDLIHHGDGIVRIADDALAALVESQLLTGQNVLAATLTVSLEVTCGADERPLHVVALTQLIQSLTLCPCQRLEDVRKVRAIHDLHGVFGVHIQATSAADHYQASIAAGQNVTQMHERRAVLGKNILSPRSKGIHNSFEAVQVFLGQIQDVLHYDGLCTVDDGISACERGHFHAAIRGLLHDETSGLACCCYDCDLHNKPPFCHWLSGYELM